MPSCARLGAIVQFTALLCFFVPGCSDDVPACVETLGPECGPLYEPVYDQIFARTLKPRCATSGCHSGVDAQAGLRFDDPDQAYENLVTDGRVVSGDEACSLVVVRLAGGGGVMPPGSPLTNAERCVIERWVANGASR